MIKVILLLILFFFVIYIFKLDFYNNWIAIDIHTILKNFIISK